MADETKDAIDRAADDGKAATDQAAGAAKQATDAWRDGAQKARDTFQEHVVDPAKRAGEAMRSAGQRVAEGGTTISTKLIDQAETNAQQAFAAMRAAAQARDVSEVMKIQGDYLREQGTRAMAQAKEIGELIVQFGRDAVQPLRPGGDGER